MTQLDLVTQLTNDAVLVALAGSLTFLGAVLILDPRLRKSGIGRSLITLDIGLAGLEAPSVLHRFLGLNVSDQLVFAYYFLVTIILIGAGVWQRTFIMIAAQLRRRKAAPPDPGPDEDSPAGGGPAAPGDREPAQPERGTAAGVA